MEKNIKNLLRLFLQSICDYEGEIDSQIREEILEGERTSEEFVELFLESEDAFDYAEILKEKEKLQKFKQYTHDRLDQMGIEKEPNSEHSKVGCRIGDRMDIVESIVKNKE